MEEARRCQGTSGEGRRVLGGEAQPLRTGVKRLSRLAAIPVERVGCATCLETGQGEPVGRRSG